MIITIYSHFTEESWTGVFSPSEARSLGSRSRFALLEDIFRQFNRVTDEDHLRMMLIGYDLPSLSVDDFVTIHADQGFDQTYKVTASGFEMVI